MGAQKDTKSTFDVDDLVVQLLQLKPPSWEPNSKKVRAAVDAAVDLLVTHAGAGPKGVADDLNGYADVVAAHGLSGAAAAMRKAARHLYWFLRDEEVPTDFPRSDDELVDQLGLLARTVNSAYVTGLLKKTVERLLQGHPQRSPPPKVLDGQVWSFTGTIRWDADRECWTSNNPVINGYLRTLDVLRHGTYLGDGLP